MKSLSTILLSTLILFNASLFAAEHTVDIKGMAFSPASLSVEVGDTITFTNQDSVPHTGTATDKSFDTGILNQGQSNTVEISNEGVTDFFCGVHPSMTGKVTATPVSSATDDAESEKTESSY